MMRPALLAEDEILGTNQDAGRLMLDYLLKHFTIEQVPTAEIVETIELSGVMCVED